MSDDEKVEQNKALVRRAVLDGMVAGDVDAALAAYDPDLVYHAPLMAEAPPGTSPTELMGQAITATRAAFPDLRYDLVAVVGEGDLVAVLYAWTGTHEQPLAGLPPTGRRVSSTGAIVCRIADGKIVEQWDIDDRLDVMTQLGLVPGVARMMVGP